MERKYANTMREYLEQIKTAIDEIPMAAVERVGDELFRAYVRGSQVFILGNGGSAATSSHFACDLGKGTVVHGRPRFRVIALTDNVSLITAWANDFNYEDVFVEQLANLLRARDVVIGISASGNSPNVLKALKYAREMGALTIAFTGFAGGLVKDKVDLPIVVPANRIGQVEDVHLIIQHLVCISLHERMAQLAEQATDISVAR